METITRNVETLTVTMTVDYQVAFDYLADPFSQKEWATKFVLDVEKVDGEIRATTPFGQVPLRVASNQELGTLDIYMGGDKPTRTRLIEIEKGLCVYNFTLAQPPQMPDQVWINQGLPNMKEELDHLKTILETK